MKIIISPAKKMNVDTDSLAVTALPVFLEQTRILCRSVQEMTFEEAKDLWGCNEKLARLIRAEFDLRPAAIIEMLGLRRPIYRQTAAFGHFGRTDLDLPWEKTDRVDALREAARRL